MQRSTFTLQIDLEILLTQTLINLKLICVIYGRDCSLTRKPQVLTAGVTFDNCIILIQCVVEIINKIINIMLSWFKSTRVGQTPGEDMCPN